MNRLRQDKVELMRAALDAMPPNMRRMVEHVDLFCEDKVFAGMDIERRYPDGRSNRNTMHCSYSWGQVLLHRSDRKTTIVCTERVKDIGDGDDRLIMPYMVHELAHVLHESVFFGLVDVKPLNPYAANDRYEAFAEALTTYIIPGYSDFRKSYGILEEDRKTVALFDYLTKTGKVPDWI